MTTPEMMALTGALLGLVCVGGWSGRVDTRLDCLRYLGLCAGIGLVVASFILAGCGGR